MERNLIVQKTDHEPLISIGCKDVLYTSMIFPIIPLPPLIPIFDYDEGVWANLKFEEAVDNRLESVIFRNKLNRVIYRKIFKYPYPNSGTYKYPNPDFGSFKLPFNCRDLNEAKVVLNYLGKLKSHEYTLEYWESGLQWNFGYLQN